MTPDARSPADGPVILFDGVCNLCNAAVTWVIERDRRARFRFASLQSAAAESLLREAGAAGPLPDSIVVVDAGGVHVRSEAALRIASGLGFPWSLAAAGRILPRGLRDRLYAWVARNRYRWFGRRDSCMVPSAALAARFLDATEMRVLEREHAPTAAAPPDALHAAAPDAPHATAPPIRGPVANLLLRFLIAWMVFYALPFPLGMIPGIRMQVHEIKQPWQHLVQWFGRSVLGAAPDTLPNGSGDTTWNWCEEALLLILAAAAALAWSALARFRPVSLRATDRFRTYIRYWLAAILLGYGWHKAYPLQFPVPGPSRLMERFGDASPMGILWAFMGASTPYQMMAGIAEILGGVLLLWRRTTTLGALVCAGVLSNVVALNFCYDVPVKLLSSHLLLASLVLAAPDAMRLMCVLVLNLPAPPRVLRPPGPRGRVRAWCRGLLKLAFVWMLVVIPAAQGPEMMRLIGPWKTPDPFDGLYRVEAFARTDGQPVAAEARWVQAAFDLRGSATVLRGDGTTQRFWVGRDRKDGQLRFSFVTGGTATPVDARADGEKGWVVTTELPDGGTTFTLRRIPPEETQLLGRGFHWVNEFPYNR